MEPPIDAAEKAAEKSARWDFLQYLRRFCRLCAAVGRRSAAAGAALWRLVCGGIEKLSQSFRPSKVGKKGMVLSILNYGGPVVAAAALVLTVFFWAGRSFGIEVR